MSIYAKKTSKQQTNKVRVVSKSTASAASPCVLMLTLGNQLCANRKKTINKKNKNQTSTETSKQTNKQSAS